MLLHTAFGIRYTIHNIQPHYAYALFSFIIFDQFCVFYSIWACFVFSLLLLSGPETGQPLEYLIT